MQRDWQWQVEKETELSIILPLSRQKKSIILPLNASTDPQPTDRRLAHMGPAAETFSFLKVVSCLLYLEDFYSGVIYLNLMIENDLHYCFEYGSIFKSSIGV
jgi:hypothetical protein